MPYAPSPFRVTKYGKYISYFLEALKRSDLETIKDSMNYVLFKKLPKTDRLVETEMGSFMLRRNTTDFQFVNFSYEKAVKSHLEKISKDIGLFIDIGACIGEYAIWMANKRIPTVAIEPVNYDAIIENLGWNNAINEYITIFACAAGKENKKVAFNVLEGVTSSSHLNHTELGTIECKKLDDIVSVRGINQDKLTVIKLDVEGMEIDALLGAVNILTYVKNLHIIYEYCSCGDENIRKILNRYGDFKYKDLDGVNTLAIKI